MFGITTPVGLRGRAQIGPMIYGLARIGATTGMKVEHLVPQGHRLRTRLRGKGGKPHEIRCHHDRGADLHAAIDGYGLGSDAKGSLFRTSGRDTARLTATPLPQANACQIIARRATAAGIVTKAGSRAFRATGIAPYLKNGGTLEIAAAMANHASARTTLLYDRGHDAVTRTRSSAW